jgi:hypothetical protein
MWLAIDSIHLPLLFDNRVELHALRIVARESGMSDARHLLETAGAGREYHEINGLVAKRVGSGVLGSIPHL